MASAFLKRHNLLTTCRHFITSSSSSSGASPNHRLLTNNTSSNYYSIYKHVSESGSHQLQHRHYYSRFSNSFRRAGKGVDCPAPFPFGSPVSGFSSRVVSRIGFVGWYLRMIHSRPVLTKAITSSLIYAVADLTSQTMALPSSEPYDLIRTLRMAGFGLVILGPTLHYWFNFMSKIFPGRDLLGTAKKMFLGQTLFGPSMNVVFFSLNAALQGEDGEEILARLKRDLLPTMLYGLMYWPLCDFVTFRFIPVHLQPLVSNGFSYLWTVYMTYMASLEKASE